MWTRLVATLALVGAFVGIEAMPAAAVAPGTSRVASFKLGPCNGAGRSVSFTFSGFTPNTNTYVFGGAVNLTATAPTIKFLVLGLPTPNTTILTMGDSETNARVNLVQLYPVMADASGKVDVALQGSCTGGGSVRGFVTVYFE